MRLSAIALATGLVAAIPLSATFVPSPALAQHSTPETFAPLAKQLLPAVVNIQTSQTLQARAGRPGAPGGPPGGQEMPQAPPGSPFEEFFKDFLERNRPPGAPGAPGAPQRPRRAQSLGSGFIIDSSGIVVTNNHVIDGADEINVVLQDNTTLKAELLGTDPRTDVAVLRVKPDKPLPSVKFGDSDTAEVGDWVLAIGNPFGLGGSVTSGIVSARGRNINQGMYDDFIQTDAAINRGNSGGPLFNMAGEVIGINTAIYSPSGGSIGIGFSIPSNLAKTVAAQLREHGRVRRGWLGVNIQQVTDDIAESLGLKGGARGALVARAQEDGPAYKGGVRNGDVILSFNGQDVKEMRHLPRIVADTPVGTKAPVVVWRDGKETTVTVDLGELPTEAVAAAATGTPDKPAAPTPAELAGLGLKIAPLDDETRGRFNLKPDAKGVVVTDVENGGAAAERDIRPGDLIVEIQQERVNTPKEAQDRIEALRKQGRATGLLLIENQQGQRWVPLRLKPAPGTSPG